MPLSMAEHAEQFCIHCSSGQLQSRFAFNRYFEPLTGGRVADWLPGRLALRFDWCALVYIAVNLPFKCSHEVRKFPRACVLDGPSSGGRAIKLWANPRLKNQSEASDANRSTRINSNGLRLRRCRINFIKLPAVAEQNRLKKVATLKWLRCLGSGYICVLFYPISCSESGNALYL